MKKLTDEYNELRNKIESRDVKDDRTSVSSEEKSLIE